MAQNEIQTLALNGSPSGGTCEIIFDGQATSAIAYNANAATIQAALEALSNIGSGNVSCSGGPWPGSLVTCEFTGSLAATALPEMTIDVSGLTGGSISAGVTETTPGQAGLGDLNDSVIHYWKMDETSGTLRYPSAGSINLGGTNLTSVTGVLSNGVGKSVLSSPGLYSNYYTYASIEFTPTRTFSASAWFYLSSVGTPLTLCGLYQGGNSNPLWKIHYDTGANRIQFTVVDSFGADRTVSADTFGAPPTGSWMFVSCTSSVSGASRSQTISINGGSRDSLSWSGYALTSGNQVRLDCFPTTTAVRIDELAIFNASISASDESAIYNSGSGRSYPYSAGTNEVQTLTIAGSPSVGSFTLSFNGSSTSALSYDSDASAIESALTSLSSVGTGNVACAGGPLPGSAVTVTFQNDLGSENVSPIGVEDSRLQYTVVTTQDGAPTPSQASMALSSATLTPHITAAALAFSSGSLTAAANSIQSLLSVTTASLQATGIIDSGLPTATLSSGIARSAIPQQAAITLSSGTAVPYGVATGPARLRFRIGPFAADLDPVPAQILASTSTITPFSGVLNPATLTSSSANAIPVVEATGPAILSLSTTEVTLELFGVPVAMSLSAATVLSPVLTQASMSIAATGVYEKQIAAPGFMGLSTFRIIDQNLILVTINNKQVAVPELTSQSLTIPELTGESLLTPGLVSESLL